MLLTRITRLVFITLLMGLAIFPLPSFSQQETGKKQVKELNLKEELANLTTKRNLIAKELESLKKNQTYEHDLPDIEIYIKAIDWLFRTKDFDQKDIFKRANFIAEQGIARASKLQNNQRPWQSTFNTPLARAYRSTIDDSLQAFAIIYPKDFGSNKTKKYPLHLVLHGKNEKLNEVNFLYENRGEKALSNDQDFIQLSIYGRGNNAYRWAGETDLNEAIQNFTAQEKRLGREHLIDTSRFVVRGFSMGGAGSWHLGLHQPDRWCLMGPGAGFTTTHGYVPNLPAILPQQQESCLSIYDAYLYAENAFNIPVVAYSGEIDKQKQAADIMQKHIQSFGIPMEHLIAPGLEHKFPPEWQQKAFAAYAPHIAKGRAVYPEKIKFVTYTLKYPKCDWVEILGLKKHYLRSRIEASFNGQSYQLQSENITKVAISLPSDKSNTALSGKSIAITFDGQKISATPLSVDGSMKIILEKNDKDIWAIVAPKSVVKNTKVPGIQGPIDDAFTKGFLCVTGSGTPWNELVHKASIEELERFKKDWELFFRAELPIKKDSMVTTKDLETKNLILFGDGGSNALIAKVLPRAPIQWNKSSIVIKTKTYTSAENMPAFIFPSPYSSKNYVVINSGHTFRTEDLKATNALLFPRWGDYAILKIIPGMPSKNELQISGIFDEFWALTEQPK